MKDLIRNVILRQALGKTESLGDSTVKKAIVSGHQPAQYFLDGIVVKVVPVDQFVKEEVGFGSWG